MSSSGSRQRHDARGRAAGRAVQGSATVDEAPDESRSRVKGPDEADVVEGRCWGAADADVRTQQHDSADQSASSQPLNTPCPARNTAMPSIQRRRQMLVLTACKSFMGSNELETRCCTPPRSKSASFRESLGLSGPLIQALFFSSPCLLLAICCRYTCGSKKLKTVRHVHVMVVGWTPANHARALSMRLFPSVALPRCIP